MNIYIYDKLMKIEFFMIYEFNIIEMKFENLVKNMIIFDYENKEING